ncbi:MAG TPA: MFS transporter [Nocardioides sp.]|uniref:MFS transporter n=1 Tax=Nocardioides sp. TaxID=35761 RepID=UPI002D7E689C|nr:MFS transporter [Nocardioides sp.]HET6651844.1 MFS transporter [Nocardioides sp.]
MTTPRFVGNDAGPSGLPGLAEPVERVGGGWVARVTLAGLGVWAGFFGPIQVLLAQQAELVAPGDKEFVFGLVTGLGSAVSVVANPLFGALSDRTTSRFGRRVPWVLGGALVGAAALLVLAVADSVAVMVLGWCLAQAALNAMYAALTATVPDLVPVRQRGVVGGWVAVSQTLGIVGGVGVATLTGGVRAGYVATAAAVVVLTLPYLLRSLDVPLPASLRPLWNLRDFVRGFWVSPRRHPDFAWAWLTRFLVNLGNSLGTLLLYFYLDDAVGHDDPEAGVFVLTVVYAVFIVASTVVFGQWSDRLRRRKVFVIAAGLVTGAAALTLALFPTWTGALVGACVLGVGYGVYLSVDFALCTEVLPAAASRARDLGVINVANALPQVFAPFLGALLITSAGGYVSLYVTAAVACVLGSVLVTRIKSVA